MISTCLYLSIIYQSHSDVEDNEGCVLDQLKNLMVSKPKKVTLGHNIPAPVISNFSDISGRDNVINLYNSAGEELLVGGDNHECPTENDP